MPSNPTAAFDVLTASGDELERRYLPTPRHDFADAIEQVRNETRSAERIRQIRCGGSDAGLAYGKLRKEYDALKQSRDTDLARARVEGAREALDRVASMTWAQVLPEPSALAFDKRVLAFRDREYPAPKPAECRKRIGDVHGIPMYADPTAPKDRIIFEYEGEVVASCAIHPDSPVLRKNAATRTEDTTDGR